MLRFVDSADTYVTANILQKWSTELTSTIVSNGRFGKCIRINSGSGVHVSKTFDAQPTWIVGFAYRVSNFISSSIVYFQDSGTVQCALQLNADGKLSVVRGTGTVITGATSSVLLTTNAWHYVEMKVTIADSIAANSCIVKLNGVEIINVPAGQDLKAHTTSVANQIVFRGTISLNTADYDDIYVCDGTGTVNNDFRGDSKSIVGLPTANGSSNQFTPSTGSNYQNIDDVETDSDTTYNESATVGHIDLFPVPPLSSVLSVIHGVQVAFHAHKTDAASANVRAVLRIGGTNYFGTTTPVIDTYQYYMYIWEVNPSNGLAWTKATYESCEIGYQYVS